MRLKRTFVQGKMNKDIDERLLPSGQYPHAENIRVVNTDSSDVGAIENARGNFKLTSLNLTNAVTIGAYQDGSNRKLYWFVTSDTKDLVVEYDFNNGQTEILLESSKPNSLLNFNQNYLITGVTKIINGDSSKDLLCWTDDLNNPRIINIQRSKSYLPDGFTEDDISLIKKPPRFAPEIQLTLTSSTLENNLENKFLAFAYRYKYLDGEYSALSSFSYYTFEPKEFRLDFQTLQNNGMVNAFNAVDIIFDTGSSQVTDIELVFKESNSNNVSIIETFNKENESWLDNEQRTFQFSNNQEYRVLPEDELFRTFDNVPRVAKALELIGNRLVFGNYVEGYNLEDVSGNKIFVDYDVSLIHNNLSGEELNISFSNSNVPDEILNIDLTGISLDKDTRLVFDIRLSEITNGSGNFDFIYSFILNKDYTDAQDLATDSDFIVFVEQIMTNTFLELYEATPPPDSSVIGNTPYQITSSTPTSISIISPSLEYEIDDGINPPTTEFSYWAYINTTRVYFREIGMSTSLKTNRDYEVGVLYMDEYGRTSTLFTDSNNTLYVEQQYSTFQNKIRVEVKNNPYFWADRYKFVVKQNKGLYQTLYVSVFYEDGIYRWIKLDGANVNKVKEGDNLIVKSDLDGVVDEIIKVRVIEIVSQPANFIEGNEDADGNEIIEEEGLYMKIKPTGFDMNYSDSIFQNYDYYEARRSGRPDVFIGENEGTLVGYFDSDTSMYVDFPINAGSSIDIRFRNYESDGYNALYERSFIVQGNYANFEDWWNSEVIDLGDQEPNFDWEFIRDGSDNSLVLRVEGAQSGAAFERSKLSCQIDLRLVEGLVIFETEPQETDVDIFYETEETFEIINNFHQGNIQNQTGSQNAIVELDFFNCYVQGNGAESYQYLDDITTNYLNIDLRPTTTSLEEYREVRRYADLTYSEVYNENNNVNGLNEFNLARANYKEDIDKRYGYIQKLHARDTDLIVFQEDKVSKVLYGKDLLLNADGTSNVSSIQEVLGQQIAYTGEYGISRNPESFAFDGFHIYFTDVKRGAVMRLGTDGLTEISMFGMRQFFKENFRQSFNAPKLGGFDPYYDQYVLYPNEGLEITRDTKIRIYFDSSGSLGNTLTQLEIMRDTLLKDALLPIYDNDEQLYDDSVVIIEDPDERTFDMLNMQGDTPEGNVVTMVFQDESSPYGTDSPTQCPSTGQYNTDISIFRDRLNSFPINYYRGIIFRVKQFTSEGTNFRNFLRSVQLGSDCYSGTNGLSDRTEINYKLDVNKDDTPQYYLDQITQALIELGYIL